MIMYEEFKWLEKEAVVGYFKVVSRIRLAGVR
jgi:hypothetical protein